MPDLLLELLSEEIPARMQARAADDLKRLVTGALMEAGFLFEAAQAFATPRRLALHVVGLPARGRDLREERKGPRVGAPDAAVLGFVKSAGVASVANLTIQTDPKKGDFYVAIAERAGRPTPDVVAEILPGLLRAFPWPKSMRWGTAAPGSLRWVRPLQSILCTFGTDVETPEIVAFEVDGIVAGDLTRGHRFLAPEPFRARRFDDYVAGLDARKVILDPARRRDVIRHDARDLAFAQGLEVVEDEALLEEVAGLVEWPVVLMGSFDPAFLAVPEEAIRATIRQNQKCFVLREPGGRLANRFLLTANIEASDGGAAIVAGNERVVRARLSDARFFWEQDLKAPLESRLAKLDSIVFHEKLGTQGQRVARIAGLARDLAAVTGADPAKAERAARLAKADLTTEMVGEFPELQGLMGRTYAQAQGEDGAVATAIEDHYRPLGPSDRVPSDPVAVAVALADKLDTLAGFWAIDEKPTGSKDPFALRRAALGVIRLVLENALRLPLGRWASADLLAFFHDRLTVYLRDRGARHDLIDAVLGAGGTTGSGEPAAANDDLLAVVRRVEALGAFLDTEDGANLLAGTKRAANILRIEEKKDGRRYDGTPDEAALVLPEERAVAAALVSAARDATDAMRREDYAAAMTALARLRPAVDAFFDKVTVNDPDPALRTNRLTLLAGLREATRAVADFGKVGS